MPRVSKCQQNACSSPHKIIFGIVTRSHALWTVELINFQRNACRYIDHRIHAITPSLLNVHKSRRHRSFIHALAGHCRHDPTNYFNLKLDINRVKWAVYAWPFSVLCAKHQRRKTASKLNSKFAITAIICTNFSAPLNNDQIYFTAHSAACHRHSMHHQPVCVHSDFTTPLCAIISFSPWSIFY